MRDDEEGRNYIVEEIKKTQTITSTNMKKN